jgi:3-carboxy-cis,cis-muconate cycloisomerase
LSFAALDSRLVGPLFASEAMAGVFSDEAWLAAMIRTEAALAEAEAGLGLVPPELAPAIAALSPADLDLAALGRETARAGVPVIPFLKALRAKLPAQLEPHLHKGATTQDILDTALVLRLREALALLAADLGPTLDGLARLAERHRRTPCAGRTYGQHAAPVTFGFKAATWALGLAEVSAELPRQRRRCFAVSLGGPVGTLAGLGHAGPAVLERFRADAAPWHVRRTRIAGLGAWLAELMGALAKLATDVAHLASTEVGEVEEPYLPGRGGSSAMPHKRNPVSSTVILSAHMAAKGPMIILFDAMAAAHERPAGAWHAEWHALPTLFGLASGALQEARRLAEGLTIHPDRMRAGLDLTRGLLFADAAAAALAPSLGGREAAHALVEQAAAEVRDRGEDLAAVLRRLVREPAAREALERAFDLEPAVAAAALWTDRALVEVERARAALRDEEGSCP